MDRMVEKLDRVYYRQKLRLNRHTKRGRNIYRKAEIRT